MNESHFSMNPDDPAVLYVSVDPPAVFEKGHPERCHNIQLTRFGWVDDLKSVTKSNVRSIVIFSFHSVCANEAKRLAEEAGIHVGAVLYGSPKELEERGIKMAKIPAMSVDELKKEFDRFTVIDVREKSELATGFIPGAIHIPLNNLKSKKFKLEKGKVYAAVCAHGNRSRTAANILLENGFDARTVTGGMAMWLIRQFEVEYPQ